MIEVKNIRLLALFLLNLFTINFTYADVNLYGKLISSIQNDTAYSTQTLNQSSAVDDSSYFGIHGNETITQQSLFIWQVEQFINLTGNTSNSISTANGLIVPQNSTSTGKQLVEFNTLASSDSYVGVKGEWGSIKLGNISSYMRSQMVDIDVFNYVFGANGLTNWSRSNYTILPN